MTNSKIKAYGIFSLILSGLLFAGIFFSIYTLISVFFLGGHIIPRGTLPPFGAILFIILFTFFLVVIYNSWTHYAFNIKIDTDAKTMIFKNIFTRQTKYYSFTDFDSYMDTYPVTGKGGAYRVLYLIKDKKSEKIISGFYYRNIDELKDAISSIKYLGFQKNFSTIARKALLNRPIIGD